QPRSWSLVVGRWSLVVGRWSLVVGRWWRTNDSDHVTYKLCHMRAAVVLLLCLASAAAACRRAVHERRLPLHGQVQSLEPQRRLVTLKHDEIKGFMPAMTMPYEVEERKALDGLAPGDVIDATLVVMLNGAHLTGIRKVGTAPLDAPPPEAPN